MHSPSVPTPARLLSLLLAVVLPLTGSPLLAAKTTRTDLARQTPVAPGEQIPVADFFRAPLLLDPQLNPAGTHFAAYCSNELDRYDLLILDLKTQKSERATAGKDKGSILDFRDYRWLNDTRILFSVTQDKFYSQGLFSLDIRRISEAVPLIGHSAFRVISVPRDTPTHPLVWIVQNATALGGDGGTIQLDGTTTMFGTTWSIKVLAPVLRTFPKPSGNQTYGYLPDKDGNLALAYTSSEGKVGLQVLQGDAWVTSPVNTREWHLLSPGRWPVDYLAVRKRKRGGASRIVELNLLTGEEGREVYSDKHYSLLDASVLRGTRDGRVLGLEYERSMPTVVWFDEGFAALHAGLSKGLPGRHCQISSSSRDESLLIVTARSDVAPDEYFLLDRGARKLSAIGSSRPWIQASRMQAMNRVSYRSRDGLELEGYLTLPAGASATQPAPLVVMPHGGPFARDYWGWDPAVQFLASRGYAVFQPNYRGSDGYDWGDALEDPLLFRRIHDDVTDGVRHLIARGQVDPRRIAIMGWSFGGYLALSGVVHEPELYRCAIPLAGVYDWELFMRDLRSKDDTEERYHHLRRLLESPQKQKDVYEQISPLRGVANIRVPVLVAHGGKDETVYPEESTRLIAELRKHKIPFEKQIESDDGHGYRRIENNVRLYTAIEAFLARNMAPEKPKKP